MNFSKQSKDMVMQEGDAVIVFMSHDNMDYIKLKRDAIANNRFGAFHHNDFIGKPFGSKITTRTSAGYIYALEPTPELWSIAVKHRTQIVNDLDASVVLFSLDVRPGSVVVESGTGSGSMSAAIARAVAPHGHLYTFEFNASRADAARDDFAMLGIGSLVTVTHRDVCGKDGQAGGFADILQDKLADAVFLDLPEPWLAISHAKQVLRPGKALCSYSPCMEQVMRTCEKMREEGFHSIRMCEVRRRPYDLRTISFRVPALEPLALESDAVGLGLGLGLESAVDSSEVARAMEVDAADGDTEERTDTHPCQEADVEAEVEAEEENGDRVRVRVRDQTSSQGGAKRRRRQQVVVENEYSTQSVLRLHSQVRGHSAFLTFATRAAYGKDKAHEGAEAH